MKDLLQKQPKTLLALAVLVALLQASGLLTEPLTQKGDDRLRLVHADRLRGQKVGGRMLQRLEGNIVFRQGDALMSCDRAVRDEERGTVVFFGNVLIDTGRRRLRAERVAYDERTRVEEASGNPVIYDSTRILSSESIFYYEIEERAVAEGRVALVDTARFTTLTCGYLEYLRETGYAVASRAPVLTKTDSTGSDSIQIRGLRLEIFEGGDRAVATDSVVIKRGKLTANCGKAEYLDGQKRIVLTLQPHALHGQDDLYGDTFELLLSQTTVDTVIITGNALITSPVDSLNPGRRVNRMSGQRVAMSFVDERLEDICIEGQGTSLYHLVEEGEFRGINRVTGDVIRLNLVDGELKRVRIESSPGQTAGTYYPPRLEGLANLAASKK